MSKKVSRVKEHVSKSNGLPNKKQCINKECEQRRDDRYIDLKGILSLIYIVTEYTGDSDDISFLSTSSMDTRDCSIMKTLIIDYLPFLLSKQSIDNTEKSLLRSIKRCTIGKLYEYYTSEDDFETKINILKLCTAIILTH